MEGKRSDLVPLVSVIIPAYNSEGTLDDCIQSAISQTYQNIEIIIINDGSTDGSADIIDRYMKNDARIMTIGKKNEGLPMARRNGIDMAKGKYIQHLDSDDTLMLDAIENLVNKAESTNADIVVAPFVHCYPDRPEDNCLSNFSDFQEMSGMEYIRRMLKGEVYWCVWACFQRRSLFLDYTIETVPHISYGEDAILMIQLLTFAQKVVSMDKVIVNYNILSTSMSHWKSMNDQKYIEFRAFPVWMENYIIKKELYKELEEEFALLRIRNFFLGITFRRFDFIKNDMKRILIDLKQYPDLKRALHRRQRKILTVYQIANWLGYFYLMYYIRREKL